MFLLRCRNTCAIRAFVVHTGWNGFPSTARGWCQYSLDKPERSRRLWILHECCRAFLLANAFIPTYKPHATSNRGDTSKASLSLAGLSYLFRSRAIWFTVWYVLDLEYDSVVRVRDVMLLQHMRCFVVYELEVSDHPAAFPETRRTRNPNMNMGFGWTWYISTMQFSHNVAVVVEGSICAFILSWFSYKLSLKFGFFPRCLVIDAVDASFGLSPFTDRSFREW